MNLQIKEGDKLYVVTRQDISFGYQGVQAQHAIVEFCFQHPEIAKTWYENSNYLGFLSVANENELMALAEQAAANDIHVSVFREPDVDNEVTAIAIAPGPKSKKLVSKLELALKDK